MKHWIAGGALASLAMFSFAKLPAPDDAAKAKAAEAAAKAAWQAKVDAYQLCKSQDRVAMAYAKSSGKPVNVPAQATAKVAAVAAAKPAVSAAAKPASAASGASAAASASAPTPATASAPPPCSDPGPFAYNPPEQKPLETSGAHSPSGTAASPPSVRPESGQLQQPGKK